MPADLLTRILEKVVQAGVYGSFDFLFCVTPAATDDDAPWNFRANRADRSVFVFLEESSDFNMA